MTTTSSDLGLSTPNGLADEAVAFVREHLSDHMFGHSARSFIYVRPTAESQGLTPGRDYDEELVFLICLLHDLGISDIGDGDQRFEVDGADVARRFLLDRGVATERAEAVWTGIALHTADGIAARISPEAGVAQLGIATDIVGVGRAAVPDDLVAAAEHSFPRDDLGYRFAEDLSARICRHPDSASPINFPGSIAQLGATPGESPTWYDLVAAAGYGDLPPHRRPGAPEAAETPDNLAVLFGKRFNTRDLEGLLALYEADGVLGRPAGGPAAGLEGLRAELTNLLDQGLAVTIGDRLGTVRHGRGLALLSHSVDITASDGTTITVASTEVVRRHPDGHWLYAIDDPFFGAPASAA